MLCSNLYDGVDLYNLEDRTHIRTFPQESSPDHNVPVPVLFIENGQSALIGSTCGQVTLVDLVTNRQLKLDHGS